MPQRGSGGVRAAAFFFMQRSIAVLAVLFAFVGCSSTGGSNSTVTSAKLPAPEIQIAQLSEVPAVARFSDAALTVQYAVRVENRANQPITLKRVTVQSVGEGAYYLSSQSKPFDTVIGPTQQQDVEAWFTAQPGRSLVGVNGPVSLRVTCEFDSAAGPFQQVVMRRVNEGTDISGDKR